MKRLTVISFLVILTFYGYSAPDSSAYYAASRLDYYTNEKIGEILVFVPERLKEHKISIDLVFEYEPLNRGYLAASNGVSTVPFPMENLRQGDNEITVSFYKDDKWADSRKVFVTIRPHRDNAVKIDRASGGLSVAGLPFFPFGFYTYFPVQPALPEEEAVRGFNLISPYQNNAKKSLKERKAYMDKCAGLGMKVNYSLCSVAGAGSSESASNQGLSREKRLEMLRKEVEMFRNHPALLTWYIADEPDGKNIPHDSLQEAYHLVKELDPYHPVCMVFVSPRKAAEYSDIMDIAMADPYPVPQGKVSEVAAYSDNLKKAFWLEKPVWIVPQAFGGNEWWQREPDPKEIRVMTYLAIIHGATGIQYFIRSSPNIFPKSTAMWAECGAMALEIAELTPDINSAHPAPLLSTDDPHIHAKAWNRAGLVTIAVVNDMNKPLDFKLKMVDLDLSIDAEVLFENRQVKITDSFIEDMIDGYGTRVYRFDARLKPELKKDLVPGNLTVDPGFEDISSVGVPAACYANVGSDRGNTFFIDSRRHQQGEHSLRMNNPSAKTGVRLSFYSFEIKNNKSYTISIMARTGISPNMPGGKKGGPVQFRLGLGKEEKTFDCTDNWKNFEINDIRIMGGPEDNTRISPQLEMAGKGTAWFDLLQVYPDMVMKERRGGEAKGRIVELTTIHPEAKIFYTIDGNVPSTESLPYIIPVEIDDNVFLKAAAYKDGIQVGYIEVEVSP